MPALELTEISSVSPSLAELLRPCALRAGLSRTMHARSLVLGNPKAWLGTAYHQVLAVAGQVGDGVADRVWDKAVGEQHARTELHPLDRRFGTPERWPGYHLIRAMALMRARELKGGGTPGATTPGSLRSDADHPAGREQWLTAAEGRLIGRPDLLRDDAVIDYKTGDVYEYGEDDVVKASYIRQLQIYAFLVNESKGHWPSRGILLPMEGLPVEVALESAACERVATEVLDRLDQYNNRLVLGDVVDLADPSPNTCRWCPYQMVCPAFWSAADGSWKEHPRTAALAGEATSAPIEIHGGSAFALSLNVDEGTEVVASSAVNLAPLRSETHSALVQIVGGTRLRVVGLARRANDALMPSQRTVIARTEDLPEIVVASSAASTTTRAST